MPALAADALGTMTAVARERGDFARVRLFTYPGVLVSHPDLIEEVLIAQNRGFVKSLATRRLRAVLGSGLLTSDGDFWRRQRRLAQPAFHRDRIAAYAAVMVDAAERVAGTWRDGQQCDVHDEMMRLTLEIVGKTLFSANVGGAAQEIGRAVDDALHFLIRRINSPWVLLPDWVPSPGYGRFIRARRHLDRVVYQMIADHRRQGDRDDLLSMLLQAQDEDGQPMSDRQVRDEVMTLFLAGHETTAIALSWTWYLLAQHPEVERRLTAELAEVLGGRLPTPADLPSLTYIGHVVAESLRLYPPAWSMGRQATRNLEIGGQPVRKGTVILISQWVLHRDARFFQDPEAFRPERWEDGLAQRLPRFAYFPFGGGPRQCIGNGFALMEATLLLATLAQRYRLALVPGQSIGLDPTITLRPRGGIQMLLHLR
ncbi:MAG: cytochrome P450 [Chloroflexi bacterium]|nr:cytochrome P450 [Chloroflexota bacterium]